MLPPDVQPAHLYDSAITVYSPDGRIYQVEYAREVVKRGTTVVGVTASDGIGLLAGRRDGSRLAIQDSVEKIFQIDDHIACASCGLVADARALVSTARLIAARHKFVYGAPIEVEGLTRDLSDMMHSFTQSGGARPYGVSLLIGGLNERSRLYETDPSGAFVGYKASAVGNRRSEVMEKLEAAYRPDLTLDDAVPLAYKALMEAREVGDQGAVEGATITADGYRRLTTDEIAALAGT